MRDASRSVILSRIADGSAAAADADGGIAEWDAENADA